MYSLLLGCFSLTFHRPSEHQYVYHKFRFSVFMEASSVPHEYPVNKLFQFSNSRVSETFQFSNSRVSETSKITIPHRGLSVTAWFRAAACDFDL